MLGGAEKHGEHIGGQPTYVEQKVATVRFKDSIQNT